MHENQGSGYKCPLHHLRECSLWVNLDFNSTQLKLPRLKQQVNCLTRCRKTLSKLRYLDTSEQLRLNCYKTFIESSLLFHMTIIYHHMSDKHKQEPMSVKESAEKLSKLDLPKPSDTIDHRIHNKAWRLANFHRRPSIEIWQAAIREVPSSQT